MLKTARRVLFFSLVFVLAVSVAAWAEDATGLDSWQGKWLSSEKCLEYPEIRPALQKIAAAAGENVTEEDVVRFLSEMYETSFGALDVQGKEIAFYEKDGITEIAKYEYCIAGMEETKFGEHTVRWYKLETENPDAGNFKRIIATEVHSHGEESLGHWHMRYGSEDFEALMNNKPAMWWPTLIAFDTPLEKIVQNYEHNVEAFASFMPKKK